MVRLTNQDGSRQIIQYDGPRPWIARGAMTANSAEIEQCQAWLEEKYPGMVPPGAFRQSVICRMAPFIRASR